MDQDNLHLHIINGGRSLLTGRPIKPGHQPFAPKAALPVGLFLLFGLTFWTFGGLMALRELLRLLFGRDRILAAAGGLKSNRAAARSAHAITAREEPGRCVGATKR